MKKVYLKPLLKTHQIELASVVCASAKSLRFGTMDESKEGDWADSRAWGGSLMQDDDEAHADDNEW